MERKQLISVNLKSCQSYYQYQSSRQILSLELVNVKKIAIMRPEKLSQIYLQLKTLYFVSVSSCVKLSDGGAANAAQQSEV